jgi:hypothetical protein
MPRSVACTNEHAGKIHAHAGVPIGERLFQCIAHGPNSRTANQDVNGVMLGNNAVERRLDTVFIRDIRNKRYDLMSARPQRCNALLHNRLGRITKDNACALACKRRAELDAHSATATGYYNHFVFKTLHDSLHWGVQVLK